MSRGKTGARERLQAAGLNLYATNGFDRTTASQIAQSVGLTERTFFRYFRDKREVVFSGQEQFEDIFTQAVSHVPAHLPPYQLMASAVMHASRIFDHDHWSRLRMRCSKSSNSPSVTD